MLDFFKKVFGGVPTFRRPEQAHPVLGPAVAAARTGDVRPLAAVFASANGDENLRFAAIEACVNNYYVDLPTASATYDAWVAAAPNDLFARLARSEFHRSKVPRYNPDDPDVNEKLAEGDRRRALAAADMQVAERLAPADVLIATMKMSTLQPPDRDRSEYARLAARAPGFLHLHRTIFWTLTERWGAAPGDALAFARDLARRSGGTELPMFVPYAHWERHWYLENMRRDAASAKALLLDPQVRAECVAAYEHTLGSSQHGTTVDTWWYRQLAATWFLSVFEASGDVADRERARTELTRLGDVFVPWSSNFFWMSGKGYAELRSKLGVRG